jgi:hypothetical protein
MTIQALISGWRPGMSGLAADDGLVETEHKSASGSSGADYERAAI